MIGEGVTRLGEGVTRLVETEYGPVTVEVRGIMTGPGWARYFIKASVSSGSTWICYPPSTDVSDLYERLRCSPTFAGHVLSVAVVSFDICVQFTELLQPAEFARDLEIVGHMIFDLPITQKLVADFALEALAHTMGEI